MNILSESDFERLKSTGLLYVVEPECNGDYSDYLKIYGKEPAMVEKKYNLGNIKIRIKDAEHSRCVQEHLFQMGYYWSWPYAFSPCAVSHTSSPFIYASADGVLTWDSDESYFIMHDNSEYVFSDKEIGYKPPADMSKCPPMPNVKPPLGLRPKHIADRARMQEILEAMGRYVQEGKRIPVEWLEEFEDLNEGFE